MRKTRKPTPVNIITGPLGVGKTTAINYLLRHRPDNEKWAVLVNEYGLVGVDAALMAPESASKRSVGAEIREVVGGCICCSAAFMLELTLVQLLLRRPDRLLIEPTGLATATGILKTLDEPRIRGAVDLRSIVCLVDPSQLDQASRRKEVQDQSAAADVLLATRADLASSEQLAGFYSWANSIQPAKRFIGHAENGRIDLSLLEPGPLDSPVGHPEQLSDAYPLHHVAHKFDAVARELDDKPECSASRPIVRLTHSSPVASTIGWICWAGLVFDASRVSHWLAELARQPQHRRIKAVLRTNDGWRSFNITDGVKEVARRHASADSRLELVIEGETPAPHVLEQQLHECLTSTAATAVTACTAAPRRA